MKKTLSISKLKILLEFLIFVLFIYTDINTYFSLVQLHSYVRIVLQLLCVFALWFLKGTNIRFHIKEIAPFYLLILSILLSLVINFDSSMYSLHFICIIINSFALSTILGKDTIINFYTIFFAILCVYSVVFLILCYNFPVAFKTFFSTFSIEGQRYAEGRLTFINGFFTNVHIGIYSGVELRNYGPFSEPGKFQLYILLAFILEFFYLNKKRKNIFIIIYTIGCVSTFSTMGLILLCVLLILYIFNNFKNKKTIIYLFLLVFFGYVAVKMTNVDFLDNIEQSIIKISGQGDSFNSRFGSFIGNLQSFLYRPIFGWGYSGFLNEGAFFREYTNDNTNTIMSYFAIYGIFAGICYLYLLWKLISNLKVNNISKLILFIVLIFGTSNEYFVDSSILLLVLFCFDKSSIRELGTSYNNRKFFLKKEDSSFYESNSVLLRKQK